MASVLSSPTHLSTSAATSVRLVDVCGVVLSGLCAVHCAVTPVLVGVLPAFAGEGTETNLRRVLILLGLLGVGFGTLFHRDRRALVPLAGGLMLAALLEVGAVVPAWEVFVSLAISGLLISAHALNTRACNAHCHRCGPARFWTARVEELGASRLGSNLLAVAAAILAHAVVLAVALRVGPDVSLRAEPLPTATWEVDLVVSDSPPRDVLPQVVAPPAAPSSAAPSSAAPSSAAPSSAVALPAIEALASVAEPQDVAASPAEASAPVAFDDVLAAHPTTASHPTTAPSPTTAPTSFDQVLGTANGSERGASAASAVAGRSVPGSGSAVKRRGSSQGSGRTSASGPPVQGARLGRAPTQPAGLGARIEAHYPRSARLQGVSGVGRARLLVSAEGVVVEAQAVSETPRGSGFASACVDALSRSRGWGLPLDSSGRPVSTWIRFSCEFAVRH